MHEANKTLQLGWVCLNFKDLLLHKKMRQEIPKGSIARLQSANIYLKDVVKQ